MVRIDDIAEAALHGDALVLRSLTQDWLAVNSEVAECAPPATDDPELRTVAAALVELFAERRGQSPPAWTRLAGRMSAPTFLLQSAHTMRRLRDLCLSESPEPLRRRGLYAPSNYLDFA